MEKKVFKIYIAGPYTNKSWYKIQENIFKAWSLTTKVIEESLKFENVMVVPICPHLCYENMDGIASSEWFYSSTLELCKLCDAVFVVPCSVEDLWNSTGTVNEIKYMRAQQKPVFYEMSAFIQWLNSVS